MFFSKYLNTSTGVNYFLDKLWGDTLVYEELTLPVYYMFMYPGLGYHAVFYNSFFIELSVIGLILFICLVGIIILAYTEKKRIFNHSYTILIKQEKRNAYK